MDNLPKEIETIKSGDMSPAMIARATAPQKTFFFRRGDGMVFPCEEAEAWQIVYNQSTWKRRDFTLIGTSDGKTYARITKECLNQAKELEPVIAGKKDELSRYLRAEEKLIMDEAVDMEGDASDEVNEVNKKKVIRLRGIMDRIHKELDELESQYRSAVSDVVKRATDAEQAVAEANQAENGPEWPNRNINIVTPNTDVDGRSELLGIMGGRR